MFAAPVPIAGAAVAAGGIQAAIAREGEEPVRDHRRRLDQRQEAVAVLADVLQDAGGAIGAEHQAGGVALGEARANAADAAIVGQRGHRQRALGDVVTPE